MWLCQTTCQASSSATLLLVSQLTFSCLSLPFWMTHAIHQDFQELIMIPRHQQKSFQDGHVRRARWCRLHLKLLFMQGL